MSALVNFHTIWISRQLHCILGFIGWPKVKYPHYSAFPKVGRGFGYLRGCPSNSMTPTQNPRCVARPRRPRRPSTWGKFVFGRLRSVLVWAPSLYNSRRPRAACGNGVNGLARGRRRLRPVPFRVGAMGPSYKMHCNQNVREICSWQRFVSKTPLTLGTYLSSEVDGELSLDSGDADVARSQFLNVADILRPDKTVVKERHVHNQSG